MFVSLIPKTKTSAVLFVDLFSNGRIPYFPVVPLCLRTFWDLPFLIRPARGEHLEVREGKLRKTL